MNVKSIERNGSAATIVVEIDKDLMESGVNKAYLKARKQIMIPGFRKGKAPRKMIEAMYGAHVFYEDGLEEIFPEVYDFAVAKQEGLKAIGRPSLTDMQIGEDGGVTLTLTTEVYPEVTLGQYKGLEVEKAEATVTDEQVQAELDRMAQNVASTETVERAAEMGDTANIDFEGFDNGVPFEGGKGENYPLTIGSGSFIPGFEEQLIGKNKDEEVEVNVTFPEDYHAEDLKGKAALFKVTIKEIKEKEIPELDDEFASEVSEFDTLDEYKADIKAKLTEKKEKDAKNAKEEAVIDAIIADAAMEIPEAMLETQQRQIVQDFAQRLQMQGLSLEQYFQFTGLDAEKMLEQVKPQAERKIKSRLVLEAIVAAENIQASDEDYEEELKRMGEVYNMEVDKVKEMLGDNEKAIGQIKEDLAITKAVEFLIKEAKEK